MPLEIDYCTVDQVATELRLNKGGNPAKSDLELIALKITDQSRYIDLCCKQSFGQEGSAQTPASRDFYVEEGIVLLRPLLTQLVSVSIDDIAVSSETYYLDTRGATPTNTVPPYGQLILHNYLRSAWFERGFDSPYQPYQPYNAFGVNIRKVTVSGVWGWPSVPQAIQNACRVLAARAYRASQAGYSDQIGTVAGGTQTYNGQAIPSFVKLTLDQYELYSI